MASERTSAPASSTALLARIALLTSGLCPLAGCAWHAGLTAPAGAESVGVEIFETQRGLLERGLEPILSDALTQAVIDFVDAPLVDPARADVLVRGRIVGYQRRSGIRTPENALAETGLFVSVTAELVDRRTGRVVVPARERHVWSGYALGENADENQSAARVRALRHVAESLVLDLFGPSTPGAAADETVEEAVEAGSGR